MSSLPATTRAVPVRPRRYQRVAEPTDIRRHATRGDFSFVTSSGDTTGLVLGRLLADRMLVGLGDSVTVFGLGSGDVNPLTGMPMPLVMQHSARQPTPMPMKSMTAKSARRAHGRPRARPDEVETSLAWLEGRRPGARGTAPAR